MTYCQLDLLFGKTNMKFEISEILNKELSKVILL
jgi:hypothetical protein